MSSLMMMTDSWKMMNLQKGRPWIPLHCLEVTTRDFWRIQTTNRPRFSFLSKQILQFQPTAMQLDSLSQLKISDQEAVEIDQVVAAVDIYLLELKWLSRRQAIHMHPVHQPSPIF